MSRLRPVALGHLAAVGMAGVSLAGCGGADAGGGTLREEARVASVTDGDTLRLRDGRRVRLVQIDAPEERAECYGREATRALEVLAPRGARIVLERDPALDDADDGGRLLRYVERGGVNVNLRLVADGAAAPYFFRNARGRYAKELLAAAEGARRDRRGLWGACPAARLEPAQGSLTGRPRAAGG